MSYDLPGYPRQHERGFYSVEDAEARSNTLVEQGIATGISVSESEEQTGAPAPQTTTINVKVTVELPAPEPEEAAD